MVRTICYTRGRRSSAQQAVIITLSTVVALGACIAVAHADVRRGNDHRGGDRGGGDRDFHGRPGYAGGYYPPPPVVYGNPYYPPPPVVYAPGVGINLPGVNINIR